MSQHMSDEEALYWCIVEFDDGVQIVPQIWIKGAECCWPPYKTPAKYEKAVKAYEQFSEMWPKFPFSLLGKYRKLHSTGFTFR